MSWLEMTTTLILVVALATVASGDITGTVPSKDACLCLRLTSANIRSSACGRVIGYADPGQCFKYTGTNSDCTLDSRSYQYFEIEFGKKLGWTVGSYLTVESDDMCDPTKNRPTGNSNEYTCRVTDQGKRIHETSRRNSYDCFDTKCRNTCRGGQSVAYVKCRCTKSGKYPPATDDWRPGQNLKMANGSCNRNIAASTAIATFGSNDRYTEHAAVFIRCKDDYTAEVYDQWCGRSVGYSTYNSTHRFFDSFATITSSRKGPGFLPCRTETGGSTNCPASVSGCNKKT